MKFIVAFAALLAVAVAVPIDDPRAAQITRYESDNIGTDGYKFAFETSDGTARQEAAEVKNLGTDHEAIAVRGSISWIAADGQQYSLNFIADENGFQPEGAHLPRA
ncbi:unnamed protein product [Hermetia illucens]|uniref:Uncharacterized protein n=1 Tax=Hermetia illucens TaxID=343691 RepID=A0A7R8ULQ6_HERIL|nr:endocuticle structural protein SgAbd-6-like [Hermetia illucens]CAD7083177.1 unnamed protein product [Hermetia illucens]